MTSRADLNRLSSATSRAVDEAQKTLQRFIDSLDLTRPEMVRDELLDFVPRLTQAYGSLTAQAAADWYERVRAEQVSGSYAATLGDVVPTDRVQGTVRYAAGNLFTDTPLDVLSVLNGAVQRFVAYSGRATVARNAYHDPAKPRYARVPRGPKTCAFCEMLASRGWVYHSTQTAGLEHEYHDDCHCQIVPEWDKEQSHIAGYDPDAMYSRYLEAAGVVGNTHDQKAIVAEMRRAFPDNYTDGVIESAT